MCAKARFRFLDITRLVNRAGIGPLTGIDRVERAYLCALIDRGEPFALICRTALGFLILGSDVAAQLLAWVDAPETLPTLTGLSRLRGRRKPGLEAALRRLARARLRLGGLAAGLAAMSPAGGAYLNVGHANLGGAFLARLRQMPGLSITVMIHDTIPLDYPEFSGDRAPAEFHEKLRAVANGADLIVCPTRAVQTNIRHWCGQFGRTPPILVAPLGVEVVEPDLDAVPSGLDLTPPYFVTVGTIEPRKDHGLLLDVWAGFHATLPEAEIPRLYIIGRRGWKNQDVFHRLDHDTCMGRTVFEMANLPDRAVAALLQRSSGLLAPSRAEGFGLPVAEAAAMGVPVLANDLPVTREILQSYPIYAPAGDVYAWAGKIKMMAEQALTHPHRQSPYEVPGWAGHFNRVFCRV